MKKQWQNMPAWRAEDAQSSLLYSFLATRDFGYIGFPLLFGSRKKRKEKSPGSGYIFQVISKLVPDSRGRRTGQLGTGVGGSWPCNQDEAGIGMETLST
jgi:hypothetical protein